MQLSCLCILQLCNHHCNLIVEHCISPRRNLGRVTTLFLLCSLPLSPCRAVEKTEPRGRTSCKGMRASFPCWFIEATYIVFSCYYFAHQSTDILGGKVYEPKQLLLGLLLGFDPCVLIYIKWVYRYFLFKKFPFFLVIFLVFCCVAIMFFGPAFASPAPYDLEIINFVFIHSVIYPWISNIRIIFLPNTNIYIMFSKEESQYILLPSHHLWC